MRRCYECGAKCGASGLPYVLCPDCRPEPLLACVTDRDDEDVPAPVRPRGLVRAINLGALLGLGLIFVMLVAFLAAAYYAS